MHEQYKFIESKILYRFPKNIKEYKKRYIVDKNIKYKETNESMLLKTMVNEFDSAMSFICTYQNVYNNDSLKWLNGIKVVFKTTISKTVKKNINVQKIESVVVTDVKTELVVVNDVQIESVGVNVKTESVVVNDVQTELVVNDVKTESVGINDVNKKENNKKKKKGNIEDNTIDFNIISVVNEIETVVSDVKKKKNNKKNNIEDKPIDSNIIIE